MRRARRTLVLLGLLCAMALGCSANVIPEEPYFEPCASDADCAPRYRCLSWTGWGVPDPRMVCTLPCAVRTDCPPYFTEHCGDGTWCNEGVCGYTPCR